MNRTLVLRVLGMILSIEALCMAPSFLLALLSGGADRAVFAVTIAAAGAVGFALTRLRPENRRLQTRDGFVSVGLSWIVLSLAGAVPYTAAGFSYVDGIFETASGLTTTGATVVALPEALPVGLQFWRATTQWIGGMGVLVMVLALMPKLGEGSANLMKAESPGPIASKLHPRTSETAKSLYTIYVFLTLTETLALCVAGMPLFDALTTSMTTISTGGFMIWSESVAYYHSEAVNWILIVFMFVSSVNFSLLFLVRKGRVREALRSEELRAYAAVVLAAIAAIAAILIREMGAGLYEAVSRSAFEVVTLMTTTGFGLADYDLWPNAAKWILLLVMLIGGCAGSTAGGVKMSRVVILFKALRRELRRILHTREVRPMTLEGQRVEEPVLTSVLSFFFAYIVILLAASLIVSLDGVDMETSFSAAMTSISNVGPGLGLVGPTRNFFFLSDRSKLALSLTMLLGRLEIMPLLVLVLPSAWKK